MLQYIHSSKLQIEIKRKIIGFIVHILEKKDDLKSRVKKKIPLMKYARYRKMPIENNAKDEIKDGTEKVADDAKDAIDELKDKANDAVK